MRANSEHMNPLVSIVMCTCNGESFVEKQLQSLVDQTYSNLEIVICDDASTDRTKTILQHFANQYSCIKLFYNETNLGFTANFSKTCAMATGDYIAICDQDDIWHLEKIERMMRAWTTDVPVLYCNSVRFKDESEILYVKENLRYRRFEGEDPCKLAIFNTISGHAMLFKRTFLHSILPFKEGLMYDWHAGVQAACRGGVGYVNEILTYQRVHGGNVSVGKGFSHLEKAYKNEFNQMVDVHLKAFSALPELTPTQQLFFTQLSEHWHRGLSSSFHWPLFFFLLRHRTVVFWYKKRKFAWFSYIKHCFKLTKN